MSATKIARAVLERTFLDYVNELAAAGDPNAGRYEEVREVVLTGNPLWHLDLGRAGCRYKLEARGPEYHLFVYHRTHSEHLLQLGNTRQATDALHLLIYATAHALRVFNHQLDSKGASA